MELNILNFLEPNSLFKKSCVAVLSSLWSAPDVTRLIQLVILNEDSEDNVTSFLNVEKLLLNIIEESIPVPEFMRDGLVNLVQPTGEQIAHFITVSRCFIRMHVKPDLRLKFIWTDRGVLDLPKSAEAIIYLNIHNPDLCFVLACTFCLENILLQFPPSSLPSNLSFYPRSSLINLWVRCNVLRYRVLATDDEELYGDLSSNEILDVYNEMNNVYMLKHFIETTNESNKEETVLYLIHNATLSPFIDPKKGTFFRFLLSCVLPSKAVVFIEKNAFQFLGSLLEWTCMDLFLPAAKQLWSHLSEKEYVDLVLEIAKCAQSYNKNQDYQNLFSEFWEETPEFFKDHIYVSCTSGSFFYRLLELNRSDYMFEKIIKGVSAEVRQQMILDYEGMNLCDFLLYKRKLVSLEKLIRCCILSKEVLTEFIKNFEAFIIDDIAVQMKQRKREFRNIVKKWFD